jgi:hypothetical protein
LLAPLFLASAKHQICAHFRQTFRHLAAQSNGAPGNNGDTPGKIKKLFDVHSEILGGARRLT